MKTLIHILTILALLLTASSCSYFRFWGKKGGASSSRSFGHRVTVDAWEDAQFARWCEETENLICSSEYNYPYADED